MSLPINVPLPTCCVEDPEELLDELVILLQFCELWIEAELFEEIQGAITCAW